MEKILLVDDNQQNLYMLQVLLSANHIQVEQASNGADALEIARRAPPDMIVSDILMPVMDGYALCRAWREDERLQNIPFVFYTATYTEPKDEEFALKLGADRFIIKPTEPDKFLAQILETEKNHAAGKTLAVSKPMATVDYYKEYNATLIHKLEDKMLQLEEANRILEQDIVELKRAEEALAENEKKLRVLFETMSEGIVYEDHDGKIISANPAAERLLGLSLDQLQGRSSLDPHWKAIHEDGSPFPGETHSLHVAAKTGKPATDEVMGIFNHNSDSYIWLSVNSTPEFHPGENKPFRAYAVFRDITERKRSEAKQKLLEDQLRQSQKMDAIGQLASGIAHDFNNLLGGIIGHAELLRMSLGPESQLQQEAEAIFSASIKAASLTRQLLTFARKAPIEFQNLDLNSFIKQVVELLQRTIDHHIKITLTLPEQPAVISGDPNQLENALLNIAINARDAMPEGGQLSIVLETVDLTANSLADLHFVVVEGPYVRLSIMDTGTGMSREIKDRIFEPFFTTKEVGKGTGLGLASVYGCVKQHHGYIMVESQVGHGTQFLIYLPMAQSNEAVASF